MAETAYSTSVDFNPDSTHSNKWVTSVGKPIPAFSMSPIL